MKNKRFYLGVIIILVLVNLGTLAFLMFGGSLIIPGPIRGKAPDFLIRELNLTRVQMDEFGKLRHTHDERIRILQERDRKIHDRFFGALFLSPADTIAANRLADSIAFLRKEMDMLTFEHFRQLGQVLTGLQKIKFQQVFRQALDRAMPPPVPPLPPAPPPGPPPPPPIKN